MQRLYQVPVVRWYFKTNIRKNWSVWRNLFYEVFDIYWQVLMQRLFQVPVVMEQGLSAVRIWSWIL